MKMNFLKYIGFAALVAFGANVRAATINVASQNEFDAALESAASGDIVRVTVDGLQFNAGKIDKEITLNLNFKQFTFPTDKVDLGSGRLTIAGFGIVTGFPQATRPEDQTNVFVRSGFFPQAGLLPILKYEGNPNGWIDLATMLTMTRPAYPVTDYSLDGDPSQERFYVEEGFLPMIDDQGNLVTEGSYSAKHIAQGTIPSYNVIPLPKATISKLTVAEFMEKITKGEVALRENANVEQILQVAGRMAELETPVYAFNAYEDAAMAKAFEDMNSLSPDFVKLFKLARETESLTYQEYAIAMCMFGNWYADYSVDVEKEISSSDLSQGSPLFIGAYGFAGLEVCKNVYELVPGHKHYLAASHMSASHSFNYSLIIGAANPFYCSTIDMADENGKCRQYGKTVTVQLRIQNTNGKNHDDDGHLESILISQCRFTYGKGVIAKVGNDVLTRDEVNGAIAAGMLVDGMTVEVLNDIGAGNKITGLNAEMTIRENGFMVSEGAFEAADGYEVVNNGDHTWSVVKKTAAEVKIDVSEEVTVETDDGEAVPEEVATEAAGVVESTKEAVAGNTAAAEVAETGVAKVIFVQGEGGEGAKTAKADIAAELKAAVEANENLDSAEKEKALAQIANSEIDGYVEVKLEGTAVSVIEPTTEVAARVELKTIIYEVKPVVAVTVVTKDESGAVLGSNTVERVITNDELAKDNARLSFRLPLTDDFTKNALVQHEGDLDRIVKVQGGAGGRYVELTATHFSPFKVSRTDKEVPVVVDGGDVLGIVRYEGDAGKSERVVSVPWLSRGEDGGLDDITVAEIVTVNGLADGDMLHVWNGEKNAYDVFRWDGTAWKGARDLKTGYTPDPARKLKRGTAFWYERAQPAGDFTLMGLVSNACSTAVAPGAKKAPRMTLLTNPFPRDFDIVGKIVVKTVDSKTTGPAKGDQIVLIDSNFRYEYNGSAWGERVPGGVVDGVTQPDSFDEKKSIVVKSGEAFWYISRNGDPVIEW